MTAVRAKALALMATVVVAVMAMAPSVHAADDAALQNSKVRLDDRDGDNGYHIPKNKDLMDIRSKMMSHQVLEEYAKFMSPLRLPKTLWVEADECSAGGSPHYDPGRREITMCYEFVKEAADLEPSLQKELDGLRNPPFRVDRNGFAAGVYASVVLHESGHALFDILNVPIFGREEDAADEMAVFIALQFNPNVARVAIDGFAGLWLMENDPPTQAVPANAPDYPKGNTSEDQERRCFSDPFCAFADVHGTSTQRFFNTICIAYGADPEHYAAFQNYLPPNRDCRAEYQRLYDAFAKTVYPFLDMKQVALVKKQQWFLPSELN